VERLLAIGTALNTWDAEILESLKQEREAAEREAAERKAAELENIPWATEEDLKPFMVAMALSLQTKLKSKLNN